MFEHIRTNRRKTPLGDDVIDVYAFPYRFHFVVSEYEVYCLSYCFGRDAEDEIVRDEVDYTTFNDQPGHTTRHYYPRKQE